MWEKVETILETARQAAFSRRHSMGGLAVLTACRLASGRPPVAIYTFGSPRIGDCTFCSGYSLPTYRIVNRLDLVPEMPLASMKRLLPEAAAERENSRQAQADGRARAGYGHVKTFVYIDRDGEITLDADVEPWHTHAVARAIATRGKSFHEGITDHLISNYIRGLEGHSGKSKPACVDGFASISD